MGVIVVRASVQGQLRQVLCGIWRIQPLVVQKERGGISVNGDGSPLKSLKVTRMKGLCIMPIFGRKYLLVTLCAWGLFVPAQFSVGVSINDRTVHGAPARLRQAVECLVAAEYVRDYGLKPLKLKVGDWAWVRFHVGSIEGLWRTPDEYYIVVYAHAGRRGELLMADPNSQGGFLALRNGYRLTKHGSQWDADEGQGGYMDYEAIGRYISVLEHQPRYWVHLISGHDRCSTAD